MSKTRATIGNGHAVPASADAQSLSGLVASKHTRHKPVPKRKCVAKRSHEPRVYFRTLTKPKIPRMMSEKPAAMKKYSN